MTPFLLTVLTPQGCFFQGEIESLTLPAPDGEIGILAGRENAIIVLEKGKLSCSRKGETVSWVGDGGVFEMKDGVATLLCFAIYEEKDAEVERKKRAEALEKEKERQRKSLSEYKLGQVALTKAFDKLRRARHNSK